MDTGEPFETEIGGGENAADQDVLRRRQLAEPDSTRAQLHSAAVGPADHDAQFGSSCAERTISCASKGCDLLHSPRKRVGSPHHEPVGNIPYAALAACRAAACYACPGKLVEPPAVLSAYGGR